MQELLKRESQYRAWLKRSTILPSICRGPWYGKFRLDSSLGWSTYFLFCLRCQTLRLCLQVDQAYPFMTGGWSLILLHSANRAAYWGSVCPRYGIERRRLLDGIVSFRSSMLCSLMLCFCVLSPQWFISEFSPFSRNLPRNVHIPIVFMMSVFCAISICCASSRATWAFARDKAIPFHRFFARISPGSSIPLNAYLLSTLVQLLLGLIYLGSSTAFNAFVGVAVMCLGSSNAMAISVSLFNRRKGVAGSPFSLGKFGIFLNIISVLWIAFEIVLFSMPAVVPVTPSSTSELVVFP